MAQKIGVTFSQPHLEYLDLNFDAALATAFEFNFAHLRFGSYWDSLEKNAGNYDFSSLTELLKKCETAHQPVVLTIGVKAPRWPEFYWPNFVATKNTESAETRSQLLSFVRQTILATRHFSCITHWQVENEPLDPSGPSNLIISETVLAQEIELIKSLDNRPIIITLWGNEVVKRKLFPTAAKLADIVGIDLYYKQFVAELAGAAFYRGPQQSTDQLKNLLHSTTKPTWITELQAEPWEKDEAGYKSSSPKSISPAQLKSNLEQARQLPVDEVLLWGFEYWLWRAQQGDSSYLKLVREYLDA